MQINILGTSHSQVNSAFHRYGVDKSSTSFGCGYGGNGASVKWQVKLCDPIYDMPISKVLIRL